MKTSIAIVDNHSRLALAIADHVRTFDHYKVTMVAENGRDFIRRLSRNECPDIVLLGILMPEMDGYETAAYLKKRYPTARVLALSSMDSNEDIFRMIRKGAQGYLLKSCQASELREALDNLCSKGYHYSDWMTNHLFRRLNPVEKKTTPSYTAFSDREYVFLEMASSDLTYAQIADKMCVSTRTVDGYREALFQKMHVKSRVGMVLEAIRRGLVQL